jgi:hypothetical protein
MVFSVARRRRILLAWKLPRGRSLGQRNERITRQTKPKRKLMKLNALKTGKDSTPDIAMTEDLIILGL